MALSNHLSDKARLLKEKNDASRAKVLDKTLTQFRSEIPPLTNFQLNPRKKLVGHLDKIFSCVWSPLPQRLLSASLDGKLIVWDTTTRNKVHAISHYCTWIMSCAFSPNSEDFIACGGLDNNITIYKLNTASDQYSQTCQLKQHIGYISNCTFISGSELLSASGDQTCILWDVSKQSAVRTFKGHSQDVVDISLAPDCKTFLTASADCSVMMWDQRTSHPIRSFEGHTADVNAVKHFPNGLAFGTISDDHTAGLCDMRADQYVGRYSVGLETTFTSLAFSKSGRVLFTGADDWKCYCFDLLTQSLICSLDGGHHAPIKRVGVSPQGDALFTASWDHTIRIWN